MRQTLVRFGICFALWTGSMMAATISITTLNGPNATYPYLGGIVGFASTNDDLAPGSANYAYLGGTTFTAPGAGPTAGPNSFSDATAVPEKFESSIWSIDGSNVLTAQWVNTNLSPVPAHIMLIGDVLAITGDVAAFSSAFGGQEVALAFVPTGPSGYITVSQVGSGNLLGAIANSFNQYGEYGVLTSSPTNRLQVSLVAPGEVPEPATAALAGAALGALALSRRWLNRRRS